jgi:hypothetical protein
MKSLLDVLLQRYKSYYFRLAMLRGNLLVPNDGLKLPDLVVDL